MARSFHLSPAQCVLTYLGMSAAARACDVENSTVWRWSQDKPKGSGGNVPNKHHPALIAAAGGAISLYDLVYGRDVTLREKADRRRRAA